jgi:uncharacterized protein YqiB (DUF1249 family)
MLLDSQLVPQTIIRPKSFTGLMSLYESNYLRLLRLIPELERLDGCFRSSVAGDCDLHVEILERCRYTVTLSLTYYFDDEGRRVADPDMLVRAYLDGRLAEAMRLTGTHQHAELRRIGTRGTWYSTGSNTSDAGLKTVDSVSVSRPVTCHYWLRSRQKSRALVICIM